MEQTMTHEEVWRAVLGEVEVSISKANFVTWFRDTQIVSFEGNTVVVSVPNGFAKEWLEEKFNHYILEALRKHKNGIVLVKCVIKKESDITQKNDSPDESGAPVALQRVSAHPTVTKERFPETNLNPRYTFDNFIVGEHNELAMAACSAVCNKLGKAYNPLFIYGGVGLGKTHLIQAIGNRVKEREPDKKIRYVTSERFTQALIDSIKSQEVDKFKEEYQHIDLLIIDDIQFLSGKEKTQHEFFHIFNALYHLNKQIIISSDRPAKSIPALEERLQSRFEGGMITDVSRPDLETRVAILQKKALEKGMELDEDVLRFISENIKTNIRELEGALNRVIVSCEFSQKTPTLSFVQSALSGIISSKKRREVHGKRVIEVVGDFYNVSEENLMSKGRKKTVVRPRQVAMYLLRSELDMSYPTIGEEFGGRDHTTALHAFEKIEKEMVGNDKLREEVSYLREKIYSL